MEELLMCSVCIERYSEHQRQPVLLPRCGHSFCRSCVSMLIASGCIVCPTCRTDQRVDTAEKLPTEYTLLAIISAQENTKKETCEKHLVKLSFFCRTCSVATCGECLFEDHPTHNHDVIRAAKYISDMKQKAQEVAVKFLQALDDREQSFYKTIFSSARKISNVLRDVNVLRKDMEEARELMKGIREEESIRAATSLSEAAKFLGLKWNIQDANFARKEKAELGLIEKDEIDIAKEEAAKEMEEWNAKEKQKAAETAELEDKKEAEKAKEPKRLLKKSRTLSVIEMSKETEKVKEENEKLKISEKPNSNESEDKPSESNESKLAVEISEKQGSTTTPVEEKTTEENKKLEDLKAKDVKLKDEPKKIDQKDTESDFKGEKPPDLTTVKPRGKLSLKRPLKKLEPEDKSPTKPGDALPAIQENATAGAKTASADPKPAAVDTKPAILDTKAPAPDTKTSAADAKSLTAETKTPAGAKATTEASQETKPAASAELLVDLPKEEKEKTDKSNDKEFICKYCQKINNSDAEKSEPVTTKDCEEVILESEGKLTDCIQVPGFMICVESPDGHLAGLEWGPQGLHVHCLQFTHVDYDIVIKSSILNAMIPSKNPTVFLELSADQTIVGRVYIKLWGHLRRAHNFLALCLGERGQSYMNTKFLQVYNVNSSGERLLGGDYEYNNGRGGRGLLDDLEWNGDYAMPMKAGMITAAGSGQAATNSLFLLCSQSDPSRNFSCPFGLVCEGLKYVKEAVQYTATKQVYISDCGVLIVPPKL